MRKISSFFALLIFGLFAFTVSAAPYACPDYLFETDLSKGMSSPDVKVIQEILNLDKRTVVATIGAGSPGNETTYFGVGTREALKRFQALFIEYIGIANGKFGPRTRTSMNAVCKGPFFTGGTGNVYDEGTNTTTITDMIPPVVAVAGPTSGVSDTPFRAYIAGNEPIKTPDLTGLIIFGGTVTDLRKVSSTTYSFLVTPNADIEDSLTLQFEADKIEDLYGNKNEQASNEWKIFVENVTVEATSTAPFELPFIDFPVVVGSDCGAVTSVSVYDYSNPCYGKAPTDYSAMSSAAGGGEEGGGGGGGGGGQQIMQMLQGLLKNLAGLGGGGGSETGGNVGGKSRCGCTGLPTAEYSAIKGISGQQIVTGVLGGGEFYTGRQGPPPGVCGVRPANNYPKVDKCAGIPGPHLPNCCGILLDMTMKPVTGTLSPVGMFAN